jgi:ParB family chromosome partitioning protein
MTAIPLNKRFGTYGCNPNTIRHALTEGEIPTTDKRVRCIGLEAYEAAGGAGRRDLFDDRNAGYILDTALLDRLVQQSLNAAAEEVRAEGWGWTEILPEFGYTARSQFEQCEQAEVPLPETEAAELEELLGEYDALSSDLVDDDGDERPDIAERLAQIEERVDALQALAHAWLPDDMGVAGAVLYLKHDGSIGVERGLVRLEDAPERQEPDGQAGLLRGDQDQNRIASPSDAPERQAGCLI